MNAITIFIRTQAQKLTQRIGSEKIIDFAMRYGNPSIRSKLNLLKMQDVKI